MQKVHRLQKTLNDLVERSFNVQTVQRDTVLYRRTYRIKLCKELYTHTHTVNCDFSIMRLVLNDFWYERFSFKRLLWRIYPNHVIIPLLCDHRDFQMWRPFPDFFRNPKYSSANHKHIARAKQENIRPKNRCEYDTDGYGLCAYTERWLHKKFGEVI